MPLNYQGEGVLIGPIRCSITRSSKVALIQKSPSRSDNQYQDLATALIAVIVLVAYLTTNGVTLSYAHGTFQQRNAAHYELWRISARLFKSELRPLNPARPVSVR